MKPFSHEEHTTFLDAMERYGQENTGREWEQIAQVTRREIDVDHFLFCTTVRCMYVCYPVLFVVFITTSTTISCPLPPKPAGFGE